MLRWRSWSAASSACSRPPGASSTARELGFSFSSAFEDAIIKDEKLSKVMQRLLQDIARVIARRTITEPLGNALSGALPGFSFNLFSGSFRAEFSSVSVGQPYIVGTEWSVPRRGGTVQPNGVEADQRAGDPPDHLDRRPRRRCRGGGAAAAAGRANCAAGLGDDMDAVRRGCL
jgi:hypothetical protein